MVGVAIATIAIADPIPPSSTAIPTPEAAADFFPARVLGGQRPADPLSVAASQAFAPSQVFAPSAQLMWLIPAIGTRGAAVASLDALHIEDK